jgi:hypothetical protein
VAQACLLLALYMGYRNIYLVGLDHDWLASPTKHTYFFDKDPHWRDDAADFPYEIIMESILRLWKSYRHLREFAFARGTRIFNATRGGFLDVFPRVEYESLVAKRAGRPGDGERLGVVTAAVERPA